MTRSDEGPGASAGKVTPTTLPLAGDAPPVVGSSASPLRGGLVDAIGNTPLVQLRRMFPSAAIKVYAKLEALNPGGSIKDRTALSMLEGALQERLIIPGKTTVVESSSGNLAIGLAQLCRLLDLRLICVVDPKTTPQNLKILRAYGAEIDMVADPDPATGEYLPARVRRVQEIILRQPETYWTNQYANPANPQAHHRTVDEIEASIGDELDYLVCATSTCGTLRGCATYLREHGRRTRIVAVDAVGSAIFGGQSGKRLLPGHGAALRPALYEPGIEDDVIWVTDAECVVACRLLVLREALFMGGSSGGVVAAVNRLIPELEAGARVAVILPDRGERYLDTIYDDEWVASHFGDLSWEDFAR